jgi:high affinity sulfate transporter 1
MTIKPGEPGLRNDIAAGLTGAAVVLPMAMAYASIAGLPVEVGLYSAFLPMVIYALLGSSKVLSVSTTSTVAILAGTQLALVVPDGDPARLLAATASLTLMVGVVLLAARMLRLGFVANFISTPVLAGFKAGIGLVIVLGQLPKVFGIEITRQGFFRDLLSVVEQIPQSSWPTVAVGAATFVVLIGLGRLWPRAPAPLIAVGGAIAASWMIGLQPHGVAIVGLIPTGLPALTLPDVPLLWQMFPSAVGIALMSFTETVAAGRAFAAKDDPPTDANRDLVATGAAHLGGAFLGAMPGGGGTSQTAVVRSAGARTQRASLVTAAAAAATMLLLAPALALLPLATLAAVVIYFAVRMIKIKEFKAIRAVRRMEFRWAVAACIGVLVFGTLKGILVAIIMSMIGLASQAAFPHVYVIGRKRGADVLRPLSPQHPDDETFPGLLILRPEGRLFFVNAQNVAEQMKALLTRYQPRVVALDLSRVPDLEYSALQMLIEGDQRMRERGIELWVAALNPGVLEVARQSGLADQLGKERLLFNARQVIERYQANHGPDRDAPEQR